MLYPLTYSFSLFNQPKLPSTSNLQQLKKKDVRKICSQFESIFITYLLRQMRKSIPKSDFLEGTMREEFFREQWDEILAEKIAQGGGIGLAEILYEKVRHQESKMRMSLPGVKRRSNPAPGFEDMYLRKSAP